MNEMIVRQLRETCSLSEINYGQSYLQLFSAYEIWFRTITHQKSLREGLTKLRSRGEIWTDYRNNDRLQSLRPYCRQLCILTQHRPFLANRYWPGYLRDPDDWHSLIEFWYQIRCDVVHRTDHVSTGYYDRFIKLAYETLRIFMIEVLYRLNYAFASTSGNGPIPVNTDITKVARQLS